MMPVLSTILLAPILGALIICFLPKDAEKTIKTVASLATGVMLALSLYAYIAYDFTIGGMQFTEFIPWIRDLGVSYSMGVDGISLPMVLLTALIGFSSVYASYGLHERPKEFFLLLLLLIAGVMGTFITREDVEKRNPVLVTDMLRDVPGLQVTGTGPGLRPVVRIGRSAGYNCTTQIFVDGFLVNRRLGIGGGYQPDH